MFIFLSLFAVLALLIWVLSFVKVQRNQTFSDTYWLGWLGIFVWGDGLIIAPFWLCSSVFWMYLQQWNWVFLTISAFWLVRSIGETQYWIHEQFAGNHRNKPEDKMGYRLVKSDAIWFLYQLFWQMITVLSLLLTIYFSIPLFTK